MTEGRSRTTVAFKRNWKDWPWLWWLIPGLLKEQVLALRPSHIWKHKPLLFAWVVVLASVGIFALLYVKTNILRSILHYPQEQQLLLAFICGVAISLPQFTLRNDSSATDFPLGVLLTPILWIYVSPSAIWPYMVAVATIHFLSRYNVIQVVWNTTVFSLWYLVGVIVLQASVPFNAMPSEVIVIVTTIIVAVSGFLLDLLTWYLARINSYRKPEFTKDAPAIAVNNAESMLLLALGWLVVDLFQSGFVGYIGGIAIGGLMYLAKYYDTLNLHMRYQRLVVGLGETLAHPQLLQPTLSSLLAQIAEAARLGVITFAWIGSDDTCHVVEYKRRVGVRVLESPLRQRSGGDQWLRDRMDESMTTGRIVIAREIFNGALMEGYLTAGYLPGAVGVMHAFEREMLSQFGDQLSQVLVADRRMAQQSYLATHDFLTGLLNLSAFQDQLQTCLRRSGGITCAGMLDVDDFKRINDTYGHDAGDQVIKAIASRLAELLPEGASVSRLHGDEFSWFHSWHENRASLELRRAYSSIQKQISVPITYDGEEIKVSCTIGLAVFQNEGATVRSTMELTDKAMYLGKQLGKSKVAWLNDSEGIGGVAPAAA
jgi:diguanylate cyclase (GGDEF)-like protein